MPALPPEKADRPGGGAVTASVVIVSHNSSPLLVECVQSVLASSVPVEVIVSDNDSTDGSIEAIEDMAERDARLRVLRHGCNHGFSAGNNRVLPLLGGEHVLFLNPDCLLQPDTIERVLTALAATPDAGMAGCLIRNPDGSEERNCRRRLPTPRMLLGRLLKANAEEGTPLPDRPVAVEAISGAFMLVRREDLDRIGSFDEGYFMHWEDLDLCRRFRDAGREILFVPDVEIVHVKGRSSRRRPLRVEWYKHRGLMRFFRKFHFANWPTLFIAPIIVAICMRFFVRALAMLVSGRGEETQVARRADEDVRPEIWVFGATSLVAGYLLPRLLAARYRVRAFCRDPARAGVAETPHLSWHAIDMKGAAALPPEGRPETLVHLAPLFALPSMLPALAARGLREVVAFGSTSAVTKIDSPEPIERQLAHDLARAESAVRAFCEEKGIRWTILRPTMIYSPGQDRNVTRLARLIDRFGFFLLPGEGRGLRQPVHADDLARACVSLLASPGVWNRVYDLSGGEVLTYRAMVEAIFRRLDRKPRIICLPGFLWRVSLAVARLVPGYRDLNMGMLRRVDEDLSFSHDEASRNFDFAPRPFQP